MKRIAIAALALLAAACQKEEPTPSRSFFDQQQQQQQQTAPSQGQLPAGHPPLEGAAPAGAGAPAGAPLLSGTIEVAEALREKTPTGTLFITARLPAAEGQRGQAVLVKRVPAPTFPYQFQLTGADAMVQGAGVPESLTLQAHLDQDGDAISRTPGDIEGSTPGAVKTGATDVKLILDGVISEAKPGMEMGG